MRLVNLSQQDASRHGEAWERIGGEYLAAPRLPKNQSEREFVRSQWLRFSELIAPKVDAIRTDLDVAVVDVADPYPDAASQSVDIAAGRFEVPGLFCDHPVWTVEQNIVFRVWHDLTGHHAHRLGFDRFGELAVYAASCLQVPEPLRPVLFVEVLAQTAAAVVNGGFGIQKAYWPRTYTLLHQTPQRSDAPTQAQRLRDAA